jgi:hypothetical protein
MKSNAFTGIVIATGLFASAAIAQPAKTPSILPHPPVRTLSIPATNTSYADIADLVVISPLIIDATIRKATKVPLEQAVGVPITLQRMVLEADVVTLLRGTDGISGQVRFLLDVPKDAKGKIPKFKKQRFFLLGSKVTGKVGSIRLSRPDALVEWSAANDLRIRQITREAVQLGAPQAITGVTSAYHSAGAVPGEGETQIFASAAGGQPYTISVTARTGKAKTWLVSTSELIEEGASTPQRETLLWYRLACGLPKSIDATLADSGDADAAARVALDYRFVLSALGPCDRTRR